MTEAGHRVCSVSVDLDSLACYHAIHGLPAPPDSAREVVLVRTLPRFLELFARRGIRATLFFVGRDVEDAAAAAAVGEAARAGHEVGNHSYTHPYDLARRPRQVIDAEVRRAHDVLAAAAGPGGGPVGFRAPGYGLAPEVLAALGDHGYRYDSSVFPSWPYYAAKAAVMAWMRLGGRRSASVASPPGDLLAPTEPYRPDVRRPWRRGQAPVVELPVAVAPTTRLPAIGTAIVAGPPWLTTRILEAMRSRRFFNLELHGVDLCDARADGVPEALVARQPDLRVALGEKQRRLEAALDRIAHDFAFEPLKDVAAIVQRYGRF